MDDPDTTVEDTSLFVEQDRGSTSSSESGLQEEETGHPALQICLGNEDPKQKEDLAESRPPHLIPKQSQSKSPLPSRDSVHSLQPESSEFETSSSSSSSPDDPSPRGSSSLHLATLNDEVDVQVAHARDRVDRFLPRDQTHAYYLRHTLHAFLEYLPDAEGRARLASDIVDTTDDEGVYAVFDCLKNCLLLPMMIPRSGKAEYDWEERHLEENCLRRDDNACVVCNYMDNVKWVDLGEPIDREICDTEVAYAIPQSYSVYEDRDPAFHASAWTTLWRYFPGTVDVIDARTVKDPVNAFTLSELLQVQFSRHQLAFEATEKKNVYKIRTFPFTSPHAKSFRNKLVELSAVYGGEDVPLPSAELLKVHHAMSLIVNATGADEFVGRYIRRMERVRTLRRDGSSNLRDYIMRFGVVPH